MLFLYLKVCLSCLRDIIGGKQMNGKTGMRAFSILLALLLVSVVVSAISAQDVYRDETAYFSSMQLSDKGGKVHLTNLPPAQEYELVTVNPSLFAADAGSGRPVAVDILGKEYLLDLKQVPAPIAEDAKCIVVNESGTFTADFPWIQCYSGTLTGDPESYAFFTVGDGVILGTIRQGNNSYTIDQVGTTEVGGVRKVVHAIYNGSTVIDVKSPFAYDLQVPVSLEEVEKLEESEKTLRAQNPQPDPRSVTTVTLCTAHDWQFRNAFPSPNYEMANMIAQMGSAFSPSDIDVGFQINAFCDIGTVLGSTTNPYDLLQVFGENIKPDRDYSDSDIAVLFTGKELDGDTIGITYDVPGSSGHAYAVVQMVNAGSTYQATFSQRCVNTAHEIGHVFGGKHQDSTGSPSYARAYHWKDWGIWDRYTAIWTPFMGDEAMLEFSSDTNHGDASHDNARRIYELKGTVAGYR